jgi:hypothetical protein
MGEGEIYTKFWSQNPKVVDHSEVIGVDGKNNIKMNLREIGWVGVEWIHQAQNRDQWWAVVNTEVNLRVL